MIKLTVIKDGQVVETSIQESEETVARWHEAQERRETFGKPSRWLTAEKLVEEGLTSEGRQDRVGQVDEETGEALSLEYFVEAEYQVIQEDITAQEQAKKESEEALAYLVSTDWLIIREMDTAQPCPPEIKQARAAARAKVI